MKGMDPIERLEWLFYVTARHDATIAEAKVAACLARRYFARDGLAVVVAMDQIATDTGLASRSASRAVASLRVAGALALDQGARNPGGREIANRYRLTIPKTLTGESPFQAKKGGPVSQGFTAETLTGESVNPDSPVPKTLTGESDSPGIAPGTQEERADSRPPPPPPDASLGEQTSKRRLNGHDVSAKPNGTATLQATDPQSGIVALTSLPQDLPPAPSRRRTRGTFTPPTPEEVVAFAKTLPPPLDGWHCAAPAFHDYYTSNGWKVGKAKAAMVDWRASLRNWIRAEQKRESQQRDRQSRPMRKLADIAD